MTEFSISGVETYWWLPAVVAFGISFFTSTGGVSGAFLLLPFQVSILGFTSPAVSSTNLVYNIVAIPGGVYRYIREDRMVWPLASMTIIGTLPGIFLGAIIRINYLPDPSAFKLFAGLVLLYLGVRLVLSIFWHSDARNSTASSDRLLTNQKKVGGSSHPALSAFSVTDTKFSLRRIEYSFEGHRYSASSPGILLLSFIVGIIGGTYGIGGGAIIAPFFVAVFGLPVYTVAGAALIGTFVTSIAGVLFYSIVAPYYADSGLAIRPDWPLGALFGLGGFFGIYCGARIQKYMPEKVIKFILVVCILFVAGKYIIGYFQ